VDSFAREICAGYQQAVNLGEYFESTPDFCPNCTFTDAADKYYWFDETIPFLPIWITLIGKKKQNNSFLFIFFEFVSSWIDFIGNYSDDPTR
jgi:hypothetical protein